jgi:hypothetical protein
VLDNEEFTVVDAKTNEDLSRSILLQIILEEEASGAPMFSSDVLADHPLLRPRHAGHDGLRIGKERPGFHRYPAQVHQHCGRPAVQPGNVDPVHERGPMMQGMMNNYIDQSKSLFVQMQEQMQNQSKNLFGTFRSRRSRRHRQKVISLRPRRKARSLQRPCRFLWAITKSHLLTPEFHQDYYRQHRMEAFPSWMQRRQWSPALVSFSAGWARRSVAVAA